MEESLLAKRIKQYRMIRDKLEQMEQDYESRRKPLLEVKARLVGWFDKFLTLTGQSSAVTVHGTVHWNTRYTAVLDDPQAFMDHVVGNQQFDLLERRANATAIKEYAEAHNILPPGVRLNPIRTVGVRKPTEKVG